MTSASAFLTACFLLMPMLSGCGDHPVAPDADGSIKIAFQHHRTDSSGLTLYTVNSDGSELTALLTSGVLYALLWSPDGSKLAFDVYGTGLWTVNADGSDPRNLGVGILPYSWFDDSEHIAYAAHDTIYSLRVATGSSRAIARGRLPAISPSGDKIAFGRGDDLYLINTDGSHVQHLADSASSGSWWWWSPDGQRIAYIKNGVLWSVTRQGDETRRLTPEGTVAGSASWSPDGTRLAYTHDKGDGTYGLGVVNADGGGASVIADDVSLPVWSPEGDVIFYHAASENMLKKIKPDGRDPTPIAPMDESYVLAVSPIPLL